MNYSFTKILFAAMMLLLVGCGSDNFMDDEVPPIPPVDAIQTFETTITAQACMRENVFVYKR